MVVQETQQSRKERERIARREEILDAARKVFSERGFERAKLDDIAIAAELSKGTLYNYFKNKEKLFVSVILRGIRRFQDFLQETVSEISEPRERLQAYVDGCFAYFELNRPLFSIFELERNSLARHLSTEMFDQICELDRRLLDDLTIELKRGIGRNEFRDLGAERMAHALFGQIHVAIIYAIREPQETDLKNEAALIKQIFFEGILEKQHAGIAKNTT